MNHKSQRATAQNWILKLVNFFGNLCWAKRSKTKNEIQSIILKRFYTHFRLWFEWAIKKTSSSTATLTAIVRNQILSGCQISLILPCLKTFSEEYRGKRSHELDVGCFQFDMPYATLCVIQTVYIAKWYYSVAWAFLAEIFCNALLSTQELLWNVSIKWNKLFVIFNKLFPK